MNSTTPAPVTACRLEDDTRIDALPRHFGRHLLKFEACVYGFMSKFASAYNGGHWDFYELSNGGFYMTPSGERFNLEIDTNGFEGSLSADAAGITACLFAFSHLSFVYTHSVFGQYFYRLREFALNHPEAGLIFRAID